MSSAREGKIPTQHAHGINCDSSDGDLAIKIRRPFTRTI